MIISNKLDVFSYLKTDYSILSIDYGAKEIGLAMSDKNYNMSFPLGVLRNHHNFYPLLQDYILKYKICFLVIGLPINMNGTNSTQTESTMAFSVRLDEFFHGIYPIYLQDERLSSRHANNLLKFVGMNRKDRTQKEDQVAASLILNTFIAELNQMQQKARPII